VLILLPVVIIILIIFTIDSLYFDDVKPTLQPEKKIIEKKDNRKSYINKYLKQ